MVLNGNTLSRFHPLIRQWFVTRVGRPTDIQEQGWFRIACGEHVLITAPTGSGKTLTAFLWAVNQLVTGRWATGQTRVLYVSPLKALNNDIYRNLLDPLGELKEVFEKAAEPFPDIRVRTRSGDTPQSDRRRMQRHPPEILITTPESLNLLLSSTGGRSILTNIKTVILDEIHGIVGNKRGVHLITAVDRLVPMSGEFQRIALSATIKPLETVAEFVGGFMLEGTGEAARFIPRPVSIVRSSEKKQYKVRVMFPAEAVNQDIEESLWEPLVAEFKKVIGRNRSTLLFANSRRLCEKLTLKINHGESRPIAYAHHGSLSREIREEVERKLKGGELRAIVATNSLEMGIDIGALDEVVLVQSPPSISSAIQRIGRAGHQVGQTSRGTIFPTHSFDLLEAALLVPGILSQGIEEIKPVRCPLDVLAQVVVSMVGVETWDLDRLYVQLKTSSPYRHLTRGQFDLVLNMLAGRYADTRIRELKPRVSIDRIDNSVAARKGALLALYISGGMIPDRGYFHIRHHATNARIGDLDEEFVWEASIGQNFTIGTQNWKIERITHNDVFVVPGHPKAMATPFWIGEENGRDFHFSSAIARFLETANDKLNAADFVAVLEDEHCMDVTASAQLIGFLKKQKEETGCALPHRHHLLIEYVSRGPGSTPGNQVVLHTMWGARVNRPFAMALDAAWEERFGHRLEVYVGNDCVVLLLPHDIKGEALLSLVTVSTAEPLLRKRLEGSGFFGARFRECAGRSLLLTRNKFSERMPLWMSRLRSQKLLDAVLRYEDFPVLLEAWRTCLMDEFDLEGLRLVLHELESGSIEWSVARTGRPSPMAQGVTWRQISQYMYMGDEPSSGRASRLRSDLLRDVIYTPSLRPTIERGLVDRFELKRKRLSPGYSPSTARDLLDWVKERVVIPGSEWNDLVSAMKRDHGGDPEDLVQQVAEKTARINPAGALEPLIVALEMMQRVAGAFYPGAQKVRIESMFPSSVFPTPKIDNTRAPDADPDEVLPTLLGEWLQFYGPVSLSYIRDTLGIGKQRLVLAIGDLVDSRKLITGRLLTDGDDDDICDAENFEILLRLSRAEAKPRFEALDIVWLPLFLASYQGLTKPEDNVDGLFQRLEQLLCYSMPAGTWESEILPARARPYETSWLDSIMQGGDLRWIGDKGRRVAFCFDSDMDLIRGEQDGENGTAEQGDGDEPSRRPAVDRPAVRKAGSGENIFPDSLGRYDFLTLMGLTKWGASELAERLWTAVWEGDVTTDTFMSLRRGIETRFQVADIAAMSEGRRGRRRRSMGRSGFSRWKGSVPFAGNWFRLTRPELADDLLALEERKKDRVRLLLDRYGILFRELLMREMPLFRWNSLFRSLRLMELSGEVLSGYFFHGIPGPQFISHGAFRLLQHKMPEERVYWLNATDPASLCGVSLDGLRGTLPKRVEATHLVYHGNRLVLVSKRHGGELSIHVPSDDPNLQLYMGPFRHMLTRPFQRLRRITIETINGESAIRSPYVDALRTSFDVVVDYRKVTLYGNELGG